MYPKKFQALIDSFSHLPGVGKKTAERYAYSFINMNKEDIHTFINILSDAENGICKCKKCGNLSENDICDICNDMNRDMNIICIVQSPKDVNVIESLNQYNGIYHVIGGMINISKGILPENLNIHTILNKINENTKEVIIALDPTVDGETTTMYISRLLDGKCKVTKLAHGIPIGGHLEYIDDLTLLKAFERRS